MKLKERNRLVRTYNHLYRRAEVELDKCFYCGANRECLDHVPPISWVESFDTTKYREQGNEFLLYPSCFKCNSYLGDKNLFDISERIEYLYQRYTKEIDKIVGLWTDEETEEMSPMFQDMIRNRTNRVKELVQRQRYLEHLLFCAE